jgi:hypothetical protein
MVRCNNIVEGDCFFFFFLLHTCTHISCEMKEKVETQSQDEHMFSSSSISHHTMAHILIYLRAKFKQ